MKLRDETEMKKMTILTDIRLWIWLTVHIILYRKENFRNHDSRVYNVRKRAN